MECSTKNLCFLYVTSIMLKHVNSAPLFLTLYLHVQLNEFHELTQSLLLISNAMHGHYSDDFTHSVLGD